MQCSRLLVKIKQESKKENPNRNTDWVLYFKYLHGNDIHKIDTVIFNFDTKQKSIINWMADKKTTTRIDMIEGRLYSIQFHQIPTSS